MSQRKPSQFELFPGTSENVREHPKPNTLFKDLTLSLENIIVLCIIFIMMVVFSFSLGIERGKRLLSKNGRDAITPTIQTSGAKEIKTEEKSERPVQQRSAPVKITIPIKTEKTNANDKAREKREVYPIPAEQKKLFKGGFTIQVASFKLEKHAQEEADRLQAKGFETFVLPKGNYSIVCVGQFIQKEDARKYSNKLKNKYNDCLVRSL